MLNEKKLLKILDKEVITVAQLREITNCELVAEIKTLKSDKKHRDLSKFQVLLANGEMYFVYLKRYFF